MKRILLVLALAAGMAGTLPAHARGELSAVSVVSALPVASLALGTSAATTGSAAGAAAVATLPLALSTTGAMLVVKGVEASARGSVYLLERASDGARASVEVAHRAGGQLSLAAGTAVVVTVIGSGVVLSAAGQAIAFLPNALGQALLASERLTP